MKKYILNRRLLLISSFLLIVECIAYSNSEKMGKETIELEPLKTSVKQPFSGKLIDLLYQAIELHKNEVSVPLEKYMVRIEEDNEFYYIFFVDPEKDPRMLGSRKEVPQYTVVACKETLIISEHYRVK